DFQGTWAEPLLAPYIERRVREWIPDSAVSVVLEQDGHAERRTRSDCALQRALGGSLSIYRRPDGKPVVAVEEAVDVSAAHAGEPPSAVPGPPPVGCDIEPVADRPAAVWRDLLGADRFALATVIAAEAREDEAAAATRVWAAAECLKKAGASLN